jgi:pimeloyl-ACP methyl ester carboxylesterase
VKNDPISSKQIRYKNAQVSGQNIFYREGGDPGSRVILLLHGFPTSSNMFRTLIPELAETFYLVAPDYPGFGLSSMPDRKDFDYSFENLTNIVEGFADQLGLKKYTLYVMDYGAPIGYRLALRHPERVEALIVQNGNAYEEGLRDFWDPIKKYWADGSEPNRDALRGLTNANSTKWQYENGVPDKSLLDPTAWLVDQVGLDRPGNVDIQMDLFFSYRTNVPLYPKFQEFFRKYQPPTLIVWGKNDFIFPPEGATPYAKDLKNIESHLLDTGHFALETHALEIAEKIRSFLQS